MSTDIPVTKGIIAMPGPTEAGAPSFTGGETLDLLEFFKLFDDLADACSLTDTEKCMIVMRYVDKMTKQFWITLEGYESHDYTTLKKSVLYYYPGAAEGRRYTHHDLASVVTAPRNDDISTETELLEYYRRFRPVALWLVANDKISGYDRDWSFWKGLPKALQRAIAWRLQVMWVDFSFSQGEPPNFEDVLQAGRLVLLDADRDLLLTQLAKSFHDERSAATATGRQNVNRPTQFDVDDDAEETNCGKGAPRDVRTNGVTSNLSILSRAQMDEIEVLARKMHTLDISDPSYSALFTRLVCLAPAASQAWAPPLSRQFMHSHSQPASATMATPLGYSYGGSHASTRKCVDIYCALGLAHSFVTDSSGDDAPQKPSLGGDLQTLI